MRQANINGSFQILDSVEPGDENVINSDKSLPMTKFLKQEIFDKVMGDDKIQSWRKPFVRWLRVGIYVMKYYRDGVKNTYLIYRETVAIFKKYEKDSKTSLTAQMYKTVEFNEIEHEHNDSSKRIRSLPLTRKQYVEYYRRDQIRKLPILVISLILFEELTAILFYLFPKLAPHNCLTPGAFFKVTKTHTNDRPMRDVLKYRSPNALLKDELFSILRRTSIFELPNWKLRLYKKLDNRKIPTELVARIHQYLFVDDWLLLECLLNDSVTKMSYKELVNCIWERQLYSSEEDLNAMVNDEVDRRVLMWRLFIYWSFRFDGTITVGGEKLFSEKWGINNVSILNFSGLKDNMLVVKKDLPMLESNTRL